MFLDFHFGRYIIPDVGRCTPIMRCTRKAVRIGRGRAAVTGNDRHIMSLVSYVAMLGRRDGRFATFFTFQKCRMKPEARILTCNQHNLTLAIRVVWNGYCY